MITFFPYRSSISSPSVSTWGRTKGPSQKNQDFSPAKSPRVEIVVKLLWGLTFPGKWYWLVVYLPIWKMMEFVTWDYDIPNIWKVIKFHGSSHHQAGYILMTLGCQDYIITKNGKYLWTLGVHQAQLCGLSNNSWCWCWDQSNRLTYLFIACIHIIGYCYPGVSELSPCLLALFPLFGLTVVASHSRYLFDISVVALMEPSHSFLGWVGPKIGHKIQWFRAFPSFVNAINCVEHSPKIG